MSKSMVNAYIDCMLWSSTDESNEQGGGPLDKNYSTEDLAPETMIRIEQDCNEFLERAENLVPELLDNYNLSDIGHDFWLTRNRHGAGFWDGDYNKEDGEALTKLAYSFGEIDPYVGDDGKIYLG